MTPISSTPRRRIPRASGRLYAHSPDAADSLPPAKRRKYVPGGPGGGGRYIDVDGVERSMDAESPQEYSHTVPRARVSRTSSSHAAMNGVDNTSPTTTYTRPRRERPPARSRQSSAAAAAAAMAQNDGYKPREERGWEEFHQDLDIDAEFMVFSAEEVDGYKTEKLLPPPPGADANQSADTGSTAAVPTVSAETPSLPTAGSAPETGLPQVPNQDVDQMKYGLLGGGPITPFRRRPGRPARRGESMLSGLGSPPAPKIVPLPAHNPREKLNLPKPSFRKVDTFASFEQEKSVQVNYVDRSMANLGYQESDVFVRPEKTFIRVAEGSIEEDLDLALTVKSDGENGASTAIIGRVEYDMDEQDDRWLDAYNLYRREEQVEAIKPAIFEITMTQIEKEWHALEKRIPKPNPKPPQTHRPRSSSAAAVNGEMPGSGEEQDTKCAVCDDGDCENTNAIVFCDGCDLAVHQECYGVPFIPEGQWLCRKCMLLGRGTPNCIFCPNLDGAFKQTNTLRWSHLLCAIWIPEVSIANSTFMEPVMDVEKVPKPRWKLSCYICHQKMGACIQCGNKNCYAAFHVTCARRAKLFLKMKSAHGGPASLDASVLKAFCDKHVPPDWRREHNVDEATAEAKEFYRQTMKGRRWADSQQAALSTPSAQPAASVEVVEDFVGEDGVARSAGNKRKRNQQQKTVWRLPSGAPVVPQLVYNNVEQSLIRFGIRKRKEFVAEACKYWTLKREARRGAALLKRLQLQMETFTSMEMTRRNYAGMGAAGAARLQRRIEFAEKLERDMEQLRLLCQLVKEREAAKLKDAELMRDLVDTVYFPIPRLLWPILERAQTLDPKGVFAEGFNNLQTKLEQRFYTSVSTFSVDLGSVFSSVIGINPIGDALDAEQQLNGLGVMHSALTPEQKDKKKLAKRIIKAVQGALEEATRKEAELGGRPFEKELRDLDALLGRSVRYRQGPEGASRDLDNGDDVSDDEHQDKPRSPRAVSNTAPGQNGVTDEGYPKAEINGTAGISATTNATTMIEPPNGIQANGRSISRGPEPTALAATNGDSSYLHTENAEPNAANMPHHAHTHEMVGSSTSNGGATAPTSNPALSYSGSTLPSVTHPEPLTPTSSEDLLAPLAFGGIPWYLEPFDPVGTTIHDERWTGREVLRGMSEELSDMDDEQLNGLMKEGMDDAVAGSNMAADTTEKSSAQKARRKARRRARQYW